MTGAPAQTLSTTTELHTLASTTCQLKISKKYLVVVYLFHEIMLWLVQRLCAECAELKYRTLPAHQRRREDIEHSNAKSDPQIKNSP